MSDPAPGRKTSEVIEKAEAALAASTSPDAALDPGEAATVAGIKASLDLTDSAAVLQFGNKVQNGIADFADGILKTVMAKDSGMVGETLSDLLMKVRGLDAEALSRKPGFLDRLFGSAKAEIGKFLGRYEAVSGQIDRIVLKLEEAKDGLMRDVVMLDMLFERNLENFRFLNLHIRAGEEVLAETRDSLLPALSAAAADPDPTLAQINAQKLRDARQALDRFEKKLHDLRLSKTITLQTMPQIRLIQSNDTVLVEKIQSSILNTIPIWKNQMVIAISIARARGALELQRAVTDTTNEMLRKNARMLKEGTVGIAEETERGLVDVETLQEVNRDLIATIDDVLRIQAEGRRKRQAAEGQLARIETELKARLTKA
ncbi:toxic anion resistance protein [Zavarzinia compransoris]|uniref:toxic anion resistance protein n=1 Tax=Zavarzinia marina TaxID=2911065 RepID=UPI001F40B842|nr:toxic anion resistance protein [Zavarzinia marina]MCF4165084.1 toxic anion resistance protein [Zavarzinia marina]